MNEQDYNQLREQGWRRRLTAHEGAELQKYLAAHPDAVFSTIVGDTNIPFYADLRKLGVTPAKLPVLMSAVTESDLQSLDPRAMAGDYVALYHQLAAQSRPRLRVVS